MYRVPPKDAKSREEVLESYAESIRAEDAMAEELAKIDPKDYPGWKEISLKPSPEVQKIHQKRYEEADKSILNIPC